MERFATLLSGPRGQALSLRRVQFDFRSGGHGENPPDWTAGGPQVAAVGGGGGPNNAPPPRRLESVEVLLGGSPADAELAAPALDFALAWGAPEVGIITPAPTAALLSRVTRLLRESPRLERLRIKVDHERSYHARTIAGGQQLGELCAALRGSRLVELDLSAVGLRQQEASGAPELAAVADALRGHPTLRGLALRWDGEASSQAERQEAAAAAIAGLIAADSTALRWLNINVDHLDLQGLAEVFGALRSNSHLKALFVCRESCRAPCAAPPEELGERFARANVLPAVRACPSLWALGWDDSKRCPQVSSEISAVLEARERQQKQQRGGGAGCWRRWRRCDGGSTAGGGAI